MGYERQVSRSVAPDRDPAAPPILSLSDEDLMARVAEDDERAFSELVRRFQGRVMNLITRVLNDRECSDDLAQEVFVRVYQNRARFDPRQQFSTWLYAIATNFVKDRYRYRARHPQVSLDAENVTTSGRNFKERIREECPTPSEQLQAQERAEIVRRAIADLPEELGTPLLLSEYEELSHARIGEILGCSEKAIETRLYRARQRLRSSLSRFLGPA